VNLTGLAIREMARRRLGLILSVAAGIVATAAFVSVETLSQGWQIFLRRRTLEMGKNIMVVPKGSAQARPWSADFGQETLPEDFVEGVAKTPKVVADHYIGKLQRRATVEGAVVVLTGHRREIGAWGREKERVGKKAEGFDIQNPGDAWLGYDVARDLKKNTGDTIVIEGQSFKVANVLPQTGEILDDMRVYISLKKMQQMFGLEGRINAIDAIGCTCPLPGKMVAPISFVKRTLEAQVRTLAEQQRLPVPEVILIRDKFEMRDTSLRAMAKVGFSISLVLLVLCGLGVAFYMYHNVSDRRYEMAVLVALGYRPLKVALAVLGKALLVGVLAGLGGYAVGSAVAVYAGEPILGIGTVRPVLGLWWMAVVAAVGLCWAAAVGVFVASLRLEPAQLLKNQ
jgi:putative ABC transport system permease protein